MKKMSSKVKQVDNDAAEILNDYKQRITLVIEGEAEIILKQTRQVIGENEKTTSNGLRKEDGEIEFVMDLPGSKKISF
jgi:hypothetical protein